MWSGGDAVVFAGPRIPLSFAFAMASSMTEEMTRVVAAIARPVLTACPRRGDGDVPQAKVGDCAGAEAPRRAATVKSHGRRCVRCGRGPPAHLTGRGPCS